MLTAACYSDQPPQFFSLGPSLEMHSSENQARSGPSFSSIPFRDPKAARVGYERIAPRLSPALATMVCSLLAESPDPDSSLLLLERLVNETSPETVRLMETHPFLAHYAIAVFGHSWYLGETLIRNPDLLHAFQRERRLDRSHSHEEFSEGLARFRSRSLERDASLILARFKRREYVRIMLRDL